MLINKNLTEIGKPKVLESISPMRSSSPGRGFEPHAEGYGNHTATTNVAGAGIQFGRAGRGPEAATGMDRGPFASRTKLTSNP